jgi:hypothetical protein
MALSSVLRVIDMQDKHVWSYVFLQLHRVYDHRSSKYNSTCLYVCARGVPALVSLWKFTRNSFPGIVAQSCSRLNQRRRVPE